MQRYCKRVEKRACFQFPECRLSYAKIMKGECNSKRKENFLSYYNLSDRIIFWIKQAASGNRKAVFIAPVGTVFIYENNAILCSANQSRDAKSCVSQAMIRYSFERWNAFRCCVFCLWDARFCVSTGRTPSLFRVKHSEMCGGILHCINMQRHFRKRINIHRQPRESAAEICESIFGGKYASFEMFC